MTKSFQLPNGSTVLVDDIDFPLALQYKWQFCKGYAKRDVWIPETQTKHSVYLHRELLGVATGVQVDHRNGNGLDNRRKNLRPCTQQQNQFNSHKKAATSSTYKGVTYSPKRSKWIGQLMVDRKTHNLGYFLTEMAAALAYDRAALHFFGEFANLNFPDVQQPLYKPNPPRPKTSTFRGVHKERDQWFASIRIGPKLHHLGAFTDEVEAAQAYDKAARQHRGTKAVLNFPS